MQIREIDVHDDADFFRSYEIQVAASLFERPDAPIWSRQECAVMFRRPEKTEERHLYAAFDGDEMVGTAATFIPLTDNTHLSFADAFVEPERRRRGIGSLLAGDLVERAKALGRPILIAQAAVPFARRTDHPYVQFARKHGFEPASTEVRRTLALPVDDARIQGWLDETAPLHAAYRIVSFIGPLPDELLASYCRVNNRLPLDAPSGDIDYEEEAMTPALWREREANLEAMGRTLVNSLALDESGEAVAASVIAVSEYKEPPDRAETKTHQWTTLVLKEHRGHRLGLALKAHNLRELQRRFPARRTVETQNHEDNGYMVSINELMGFVPVELSIELQRKL